MSQPYDEMSALRPTSSQLRLEKILSLISLANNNNLFYFVAGLK